MKTYLHILKNMTGRSLALAGAVAASQIGSGVASAQTSESRTETVTVTTGSGGGGVVGGGGGSKQTAIVIKAIDPTDSETQSGGGGGGGGVVGGGSGSKQTAIVIKAIEPSDADERAARRELPWLGVSTEEASEVLASQLGLDSGAGLVVTYIAPDSPAAKAGLQKNDVLVELESQLLVHPAQLRKLVQARKEGDNVKLGFYRAGKKQFASATLGKTKAGFGLLEDEYAWRGDLRELQRQLRDLPIGDAISKQMKTVRESLGHVQIDQKKVQEDVRRSMEQARRAYEDALRHATNMGPALRPARKALEDLAKSGALADNNASVTVRSTGKSVKTIVKADESGSITIVSTPRLHLTAHDKDGKLLFDGEIETPEQRDKVPRDLWKRVEPMLDKVAPGKAEDDESDARPARSKETTSNSRSDSDTL